MTFIKRTIGVLLSAAILYGIGFLSYFDSGELESASTSEIIFAPILLLIISTICLAILIGIGVFIIWCFND
jgi:hypothetical protein